MKFVDTSFWVALQFRRDARHPIARAIWDAGAGPLMTTTLVIGETWTFLCRRAGHRRAVEFLDAAMKLSLLTVRHVDEEAEDEAWRWLRRHDEREYSFVDATSFVLMRRLRIREALAFDGDFSAAGFTEARAI
ncbi:MAG TPA: PIN domain-containing protein [Acidimicrobiales bacterium]|nr:PIN domain-containing protein [Acidimicrobiales bacterium]